MKMERLHQCELELDRINLKVQLMLGHIQELSNRKSQLQQENAKLVKA